MKNIEKCIKSIWVKPILLSHISANNIHCKQLQQTKNSIIDGMDWENLTLKHHRHEKRLKCPPTRFDEVYLCGFCGTICFFCFKVYDLIFGIFCGFICQHPSTLLNWSKMSTFIVKAVCKIGLQCCTLSHVCSHTVRK